MLPHLSSIPFSILSVDLLQICLDTTTVWVVPWFVVSFLVPPFSAAVFSISFRHHLRCGLVVVFNGGFLRCHHLRRGLVVECDDIFLRWLCCSGSGSSSLGWWFCSVADWVDVCCRSPPCRLGMRLLFYVRGSGRVPVGGCVSSCSRSGVFGGVGVVLVEFGGGEGVLVVFRSSGSSMCSVVFFLFCLCLCFRCRVLLRD